jgi:hypothetical protein
MFNIFSLITHTKFCKFVLGVRANSSGDAVRGELGSYPILYNIVLNMIKFWLHLVKNNDKSSILADAFSLYNQTTNQNSESWVGCIIWYEFFQYMYLTNLIT